jgi:DNA helicase-2/ATP-dependent DNA helicase PcrA
MEGRSGRIDFRKELNDEQYAAVTAPRGPALVLAGAGSGKTRTLTHRVAWLREQGIRHWQILLLTFTNKAAREMIERVAKLSGDEYPTTWGGTFHSIGARVLRREGRVVGLEPNFTIMDEDDAESLFAEVAKSNFGSFFRKKDNPKPKVLQSWLSYARNTQEDVADVAREHRPDDDTPEILAKLAPLYRARKLENQVVDYDDLLTLWLEALQKSPEALGRYQRQFEHILVDEYQDTNAIQSAIVDLIASEHQIMAVGDDAQCIYTWRGAQFDNILHFPDRHPGTTIYKILDNYRSRTPILDLANDILGAQALSGAGYEKQLRAVRSGGVKPRVVACADNVSQARFVVSRVCGLNGEGLALSDIAVLYRAHYQALDLQLELTRRGIPFTITSGVRFFEQAHIRDLVAQLRLIVNPADQPAFSRVCELMPKIGSKTSLRLHNLLMDLFDRRKSAPREEGTLFGPVAKSASGRPALAHPAEALLEDEMLAKVPEPARETWKAFAETLQEALRMSAEQPEKPSRTVQILCEGWYGDYLGTVHDRPESRRDDLMALIPFADKFSSLPEMLAQLVLLSSESNEREETKSEDKLRLSTIHQAKGLEFPVVFIIGASEGSLPLQRAVDEGNVDEERRLFYVAVTRAEDELYICHPRVQVQRGGGMFSVEPSSFIGEIGCDKFESTRPRYGQ